MLLFLLEPLGAIAHSAFNFFHDYKVPLGRLQNLTILRKSLLNLHKKSAQQAQQAQHLVDFTKFVDFPEPKLTCSHSFRFFKQIFSICNFPPRDGIDI